MKIFIDPGHGGKDPGAVNGILFEKDMTLNTAKALGEYLTKQGHMVKLSRSDDLYVSIEERTNAANAWGAELFLSCHYNAGGGRRAEVIISQYKYVDAAKRLSASILEEIKAVGQTTIQTITKHNSTGTADYYGVIRQSKCPTVIIEPCFIDNTTDRQLADTTAEQQEIGTAIGRAVLKYLGQNEKEEAEIEMAVYKTINEVPTWGKEVIQKLVSKGSLKGDENGNINVSEDMLRTFVVLEREGVLK